MSSRFGSRSFVSGLTAAVFAATLAASTGHAADSTILNVSYDPTRELYQEFNEAFVKHWKAETGDTVTIQQSHGGSGAQARAVTEGLNADVVTLALEADIDAIAKNTRKIPADWRGRLANNNAPYTSTIVFLVRKGNPKGIHDWGDLVKPDVKVITPNPKTSGGARWNFLAGWAWALKEYGGDEAKAQEYVTALYKNVPVLDTGARGSTTTFTQRNIGDVLLTWENEGFLALRDLKPGEFEVIVPSISIKAEPPVALVDGNVDRKGTRTVAEAYLQYLYSDVGQQIAAKHYYRPFKSDAVSAEDLKRFPSLELVTVDDFGGWAKAQPRFFGDKGIFDQIYRPSR